MQVRRLFMCIALPVLTALAGCSGSVDHYPERWAPIRSAGWFGCPNLSGTYEYAGARADNGIHPSLSGLFLGFGHRSDATHVKVEVDGEQTKISVWNGASQINKGYWTGLRCSSSTLHSMTRDPKPSKADISKAEDGSIVALLHNDEWVLLAFIPVRHTSGKWFRWHTLEALPRGSP